MTPDIASTVAGLLVLVVVGWDLVVTVLSPTSGAGPVTGRTGQFLWRLGKLGVPTAGARRLRVLGPTVLLATVLGWIVLLVLGWWLVTLPVDGIEITVSGRRATPAERLYFVVTTVSTLGPGDVLARSAWGRTLTTAMAVTGLSLFTLAVTYVLPIVTAVTQRRVQATAISALGTDVSQVVASLDGAGDDADRLLDEIGRQVRLLAQQHLAYPVLHYFHSADRRAALAPSVATLDEAIGRLAGRSVGPPSLSLVRFRSAVDDLLWVTAHHTDPHLLPQPRADTDRPPREEVLPCRHPRGDHQRRLAAFVRDDSWDWAKDVLGMDASDQGGGQC